MLVGHPHLSNGVRIEGCCSFPWREQTSSSMRSASVFLTGGLWGLMGLPTGNQSPAEKKSNDSKGLHFSPSAASRDSKADQRRLTVKRLAPRLANSEASKPKMSRTTF